MLGIENFYCLQIVPFREEELEARRAVQEDDELRRWVSELTHHTRHSKNSDDTPSRRP